MEKPRGGGGGGIVVQNMLSKESGKHVLWSPNGGGKDCLRCGGDPKRRVHVWYWLGETPSSVGHILVSWHGQSLVPAGFSPHSTPYDTDGLARSVRRPFSRMGFLGIRRW